MLISLDVGFSNCGWSVFHGGNCIDCGVVKNPKPTKKTVRTADDRVLRAQILVRELKAIIERYQVRGVIGELPTGGAQSATAMRDMASATCAIAGMIACLNLPCEWCTPDDVKVAGAGRLCATKADIMDAIAIRYGWSKTVKTIMATASRGVNKGKKIPVDHVKYHIETTSGGAQSIAAGTFEHIADSMAAYLALRSGNLVKMFG